MKAPKNAKVSNLVLVILVFPFTSCAFAVVSKVSKVQNIICKVLNGNFSFAYCYCFSFFDSLQFFEFPIKMAMSYNWHLKFIKQLYNLKFYSVKYFNISRSRFIFCIHQCIWKVFFANWALWRNITFSLMHE